MTIHDGTPTHAWYIPMERVEEIIAARHACVTIAPVDDPNEPRKTCGHCGESKPVSVFAKHRTNKDRLDGRCRTCKRKYDRGRARRRRVAAG